MMANNRRASRRYSQFAGVVLIAVGIAGFSVPAPTSALQRVREKAVRELKPIVQKTEIGRQILDVYSEREQQCRRSL